MLNKNDGMPKKKVKLPKAIEVERQKELDKILEQEKERLEKELQKEIHEKAMSEEKKAIKDFQDPDLLLKIKMELDKDHIGDDKEKNVYFL